MYLPTSRILDQCCGKSFKSTPQSQNAVPSLPITNGGNISRVFWSAGARVCQHYHVKLTWTALSAGSFYPYIRITKLKTLFMPIINQHSFIDTTRVIERSMRSPSEIYAWEFQGTLTLLKQYSSWPNYSMNFGAQGRTKILFYGTKISYSSAVLLSFGSNRLLRIDQRHKIKSLSFSIFFAVNLPMHIQ